MWNLRYKESSYKGKHILTDDIILQENDRTAGYDFAVLSFLRYSGKFFSVHQARKHTNVTKNGNYGTFLCVLSGGAVSLL